MNAWALYLHFFADKEKLNTKSGRHINTKNIDYSDEFFLSFSNRSQSINPG
jgi:hypothetical protein